MEHERPALGHFSRFEAESDVRAIHNAMKGMGTNEDVLIDILCNRSFSQRMKITQTFKAMYGKDLPEELKKELSGNLQDILVPLTVPTSEYLAVQLHDAVDGVGTDESVILETICSRLNHEIKDIKAAYEQRYKTTLEKDIKDDVSGVLKNLLVAILQGNRDERKEVDEKKAKEDAENLLKAGEGKLGTDESEFVAILASRSFPHICKINKEYEKIKGHSLQTAIKKEFSGQTEKALLTILECAENKHAYFAKRLQGSISGLGTKDKNLIRVIVSRGDIDLANIKNEYEKIFGRSLDQDIAEDTSGDYRKALLAVLR